MYKYVIILTALLLLGSCKKRSGDRLDQYKEENIVASQWLIACAAGDEVGFGGDPELPISVFFYPETGASDFKYFSTRSLKDDKADHSNYKEWKGLTSEHVFNGYLRKFKLKDTKEHWGIVTYKLGDSLRVSDPIKITHKTRATETGEALVSVCENGTTPGFSWVDGEYVENVIYFQVVSDNTGNLISGTYTTEKTFTFYDTSNVVIDITSEANPMLWPSQVYTFTLMSVSDDNWVNVAVSKDFLTN